MPGSIVVRLGFSVVIPVITNLRLIQARPTQLDIAWDGSGDNWFRIEYRQLGDALWKLMSVLSPLSSFYTLTELNQATTWEVAVSEWDITTDLISEKAIIQASTL